MKATIYDQYGVYPSEIVDLRFTYGGEDYFIFYTDIEEEELYHLDQINQKVYQIFPDRIAKIVENKNKNLVTSSVNGPFVLITMKAMEVNLKDLMFLHFSFVNQFSNNNFNASDLLKLRERRFEFIEKEAASCLRADTNEYNLLLETLFFGYGLAENALGYLADLIADFGDSVITPTITHIRLPSLDPLVFFNPLNFYLDHSCRDLAQLYLANIIDIYQLSAMLKDYNYQQIDAAFLMARILYPSALFDMFEDIYLKNESRHQILKYHDQINAELDKIKLVHLLLVEEYQIRPISWLINHK